MGAPSFLSFDEVLLLHGRSLREFGGSDGFRDRGLIESALGSAQNAFHYGGGDLFDIAAAYAFHIAQAQAFLDGNKRTALASAVTFLKINGVPARPNIDTQMALYDAMIAIAERRMDKAGLAAVFRERFA